MKTTNTCTGCGCRITEALVDDAYCVRCRYHNPHPTRKWDALDESGNAPALPAEPETEFEFPPEEEPTVSEERLKKLADANEELALAAEKLRLGILLCIRGRRGTERGRLAALCALSGLFADQQTAADETGVSAPTVSREIARMREELRRTGTDETTAL